MFNLHSIRTKLILFFLILIMLPAAIIATALFSSSSAIIQEEVSLSIQNKLSQTSDNIDYILNNIEYSTVPVLLDNKLYNILTQKKENIQSNYQDLQDIGYIKDMLTNLALSNPHIDSTYLYNAVDDSLFVSGLWGQRYKEDANIAEWYNSVKITGDGHSWASGKSVALPGKGVKNLIYCVKIIKKRHDVNPVAILTVNIDERVIYQFLRDIKFGTTGFVFLADEKGNLISYSDQGKILQDVDSSVGISIPSGKDEGNLIKEINGVKHLVTFVTSRRFGWKYVAVVPVEEIIGKVYSIRDMAVLVGFISVFGAFVVAFLLSRGIYRPIMQLLTVMKKVEGGALNVSIDNTRKDEFGELFTGFNHMIARIKSLIEQLYHQELLKKNAEIKALQSQIHPHFLYNTLDSIHWIARINKVDEIAKITFAMSKFFRLVLSGGRDVVRLEEALELTNHYLTIQQIRYKNRFRVEIDIDRRLNDLKVPKLLFQPLVENAINYGIDRKREAGLIKLSGKVSENAVFTVWDDGNGINKERLAQIQKALLDTDITNTDYFALRNLNHQIRILFGKGFGVTIDSQEGSWTEVKIVVPLI